MVETAIYFLVGFLSATLLALIAAPAITRRAYRLAAARARLLAPLSEVQARADRDALRAQHAVEIVRTEQRLGEIADTLALCRIDLGRRDTAIVGLETKAAEQGAEIARQRAEIAALLAETAGLEAELGASRIALHDLTGQRDHVAAALTRAETQIAELETQAEGARVVIAALETHNSGLEIALGDRKRSAAEAARVAETERARLASALTSSRHNATSLEERLANVTARYEALRGEAEGRAGEVARLRERLLDQERALSQRQKSHEELTLQTTRQNARLQEREAALERAEANRRDEAQNFNARLEAAAAREGAQAERLRHAASSQAAEGGALAAARFERIELKRELDALTARLADAQTTAQTFGKGDLALRQAIAKLGREVARTRDGADEAETGPAQVMNFARRDSVAAALSPSEDRARERPLVSER